MNRSRLTQIEELESLVLLSASTADCGDILTGTECDDAFVLSDAVSQIDGRGGFDTLNITDGVASDFEITSLDDGSVLLRELSSDRTVKLIDVEQIVFADCETVSIEPQATASQATAATNAASDANNGSNAAAASEGTQLSDVDNPATGTESSPPPSDLETEDPDGPFVTEPGDGASTDSSDPEGPPNDFAPGSSGGAPPSPPEPISEEEVTTTPPPAFEPPENSEAVSEPVEEPAPASISEERESIQQAPIEVPALEGADSVTNELPEVTEGPIESIESEVVQFVDSPTEASETFEPQPFEIAQAVETSDSTAASSSDFLQQVLDLTNEIRIENGLAPLTFNSELQAAAQIHADNLAVGDFFDHVGLDGTQPWDRAEAAGYDYQTIGENIAAGQLTPQEVVQGWYESAGHRANILNPAFTELGVGYSFLENDTGNVNFNHYWSQLFGTER